MRKESNSPIFSDIFEQVGKKDYLHTHAHTHTHTHTQRHVCAVRDGGLERVRKRE